MASKNRCSDWDLGRQMRRDMENCEAFDTAPFIHNHASAADKLQLLQTSQIADFDLFLDEVWTPWLVVK